MSAEPKNIPLVLLSFFGSFLFHFLTLSKKRHFREPEDQQVYGWFLYRSNNVCTGFYGEYIQLIAAFLPAMKA